MNLDTLSVIGYSSIPDHPNIQVLADGLERWGWPRLELTIGPYWSHVVKLFFLRAKCQQLHAAGKTHYVFLDTFDTVCVGPPGVLEGQVDEGVLISAELACWPDAELESQYPKEHQHSRWKHVNSGGILGNVEYTLTLLRLMNIENQTDDQRAWTRLFIGRVPGLRLDSRCQIFQTIGHVHQYATMFRRLEDGRFENLETGTRPAFIHGNGTMFNDPKVYDFFTQGK